MAETHYHPCNMGPCLKGASDGVEWSVWIAVDGGFNVVTNGADDSEEWAQRYAEKSFLGGTPAVVMMRDVIRTPWRKAEM